MAGKASRKGYLSPRSEDWTDDDIQTIATYDFEVRQPKERYALSALNGLRRVGLFLVQFLARELREPSEEDLEWYKVERKKDEVYYSSSSSHIEEAKQELKQLAEESRQERQRYVEDNLTTFLREHHFEILFWLEDWYGFWTEDFFPLKPSQLDWMIYFTLMYPRPPASPFRGFHGLFPALYDAAMERVIRPQYLKYLWNTRSLREAILQEDLTGVDVRIVSWYEARLWILKCYKKEFHIPTKRPKRPLSTP